MMSLLAYPACVALGAFIVSLFASSAYGRGFHDGCERTVALVNKALDEAATLRPIPASAEVRAEARRRQP